MSKKKKSWVVGFLIFALLMLAIMINEAMDYPEDFKRGHDANVRAEKVADQFY